MSLEVIGTGFGRTGTDSMRNALNLLGFAPCHHMYEVMGNPKQVELWRSIARGMAPDWDQVFQGFKACVDWPSALYWPALIRHFPDAKVILTYRDPESWWASFDKTIGPGVEEDANPLDFGNMGIRDQTFGGKVRDKDHCMAIYQANIDRVKAEVPAERLFVHELGSGWDGLCAHLGRPVPDAPFPSGNTVTEFHAKLEEEGRA